jgi:hypothetical protein
MCQKPITCECALAATGLVQRVASPARGVERVMVRGSWPAAGRVPRGPVERQTVSPAVIPRYPRKALQGR